MAQKQSHPHHAGWYTRNWVPFLFDLGDYWFGKPKKSLNRRWWFFLIGDVISFLAIPVLLGIKGNGKDARTNSGIVASRSHWVRIIANGIAALVVAMAMGMAGGAGDFMHAGAEMPLWADILAGLALSINMAAICVGSSAKHHKIQQAYDPLLTLQEFKNEAECEALKKNNADAIYTPALLRMSWIVRAVNIPRYLHDINGFAGTAVSMVVCIAYAATLMGMSVGIPLFVVGVLFIASRLSAMASAAFAPVTDWARSYAHETDIIDRTKIYIAADNNRVISTALESVFQGIHPGRGKDLVYYRCYRACQRFLVKQQDAKISPDKIRCVLNHYIERNRILTGKIETAEGLPYLDALNFIEVKVLASLREVKMDIKKIASKNGMPETLLLAEMESQGMKPEDIYFNQTCLFQFDPSSQKGKINDVGVCKHLPVYSNPHGTDRLVIKLHTDALMRVTQGPRQI